MLTAYTELSEVDQLRCDYSDFHKEIYGVRSYLREDISVEDARAAMEQLAKFSVAEFARQDAMEQECIAKFEALVATTIASGAKSREVALRWMMDASGCDGDWDYFCYNHSIPYGYTKVAA